MAAGKTYGIHDVQMRFNKETDEIEILLPGNSSDPTKIIKLPNGGGGSGQGFPVENARQIVFQGDEVLTDIHTSEDNPAGLQSDGDVTIQVNAQIDTIANINLNAVGNNRKGIVQLTARGIRVAEFEVDQLDTQRFGIFSKASAGHAAQTAAIPNAADLATAITAINALLASQRGYGWITE